MYLSLGPPLTNPRSTPDTIGYKIKLVWMSVNFDCLASYLSRQTYIQTTKNVLHQTNFMTSSLVETPSLRIYKE